VAGIEPASSSWPGSYSTIELSHCQLCPPFSFSLTFSRRTNSNLQIAASYYLKGVGTLLLCHWGEVVARPGVEPGYLGYEPNVLPVTPPRHVAPVLTHRDVMIACQMKELIDCAASVLPSDIFSGPLSQSINNIKELYEL
jgi:hypothetical protein